MEEIKSILKFAPSHKYGYYIELLLYTGLRVGELYALKWSNVDSKNKIIYICQAVSRDENGYYEKDGTKNNKTRHIGITQKLQAVLDRIPKNGFVCIVR